MNSTSSKLTTGSRRDLLILLVLALFVRGGFLLATPHALESDPDAYHSLAENLWGQGVFGHGEHPTAYRPPLYPLVIAPLLALDEWSTAAIGVLHVLLGMAAVVLVYHLGYRWGLDRLSVVSAALVAIDPLLLMQSTLVMTETLATFLAIAALLGITAAAERPAPARAGLAGGAAGLAVLCRPTFLPWMVVCALALPWFADRWGDRAKLFAAFTLAATVVLSPWVVRNQLWFGRPIAGTTHGGYTLLLANNPWYYEHLRVAPWRTVWTADELERWWLTQASRSTPAEELRADRLAYEHAKETIRRHPQTFLYASLLRVGGLWSPLPHQVDPQEGRAERLARYAVCAWYVAEFALALLGLATVLRLSTLDARLSASWRSTWMWGILLVLVFTGVHSLYWSNIRMRAPLMPIVAMAAAAGIARLASSIARGKPDSA